MMYGRKIRHFNHQSMKFYGINAYVALSELIFLLIYMELKHFVYDCINNYCYAHVLCFHNYN